MGIVSQSEEKVKGDFEFCEKIHKKISCDISANLAGSSCQTLRNML